MHQDKIFYLTRQGLRKTKQDYEQLKKLRKIKLGGEAPAAFFSEELNAEFVSFRDDMNLLDNKLEELEHVLKHHELIKSPKEKDEITLGATVNIEVGGHKDTILMVGTIEANPSLGKISNESPVGRALLGLKQGDEAVIESPDKLVYKIKKVSYK